MKKIFITFFVMALFLVFACDTSKQAGAASTATQEPKNIVKEADSKAKLTPANATKKELPSKAAMPDLDSPTPIRDTSGSKY